jgi:hypothetical protein
MIDLIIENIDNLIIYGQTHVKNNENEKIQNLEFLLVSIYKQIIELPDKFDKQADIECPKTDYDLIKKQVENNFKGFGYYNVVFNGIENIENPETVIGDSRDDLTDIIRDLIEAKWYFKNSSFNDAIWQIKFNFETHTRHHILGLLKYIHDTKR